MSDPASDETATRSRPAILLVGLDAAAAAELTRALSPSCAVLEVPCEAQAFELWRRREVAVLCLAGSLAGLSAASFLDRAHDRQLTDGVVIVVLDAGPSLEPFQDHVDNDLLFYLSREMPGLAETRLILEGALGCSRSTARREGIDEAGILDRASALADAGDLAEAAGMLERAAQSLVRADEALCLLYDIERDLLWSPGTSSEDGAEASAAAGLVSYALRTGASVRLARAQEDGRYDADADSLGRPWSGALLAVPVRPPGRRATDGTAGGGLGVLVALRCAAPPFTARDERSLELLAAQAAPVLQRFTLAALADRRAASRGADDLFRDQALDRHARWSATEGRALEISPRLTGAVLALLLPALVAAALVLWLESATQYASGPAIVRRADREEVASAVTGTVESLLVAPSSFVRAGDPLVRLHDAGETAELERLDRELELRLIERLRDPDDESSALGVAALRAQRRAARSRWEQRVIRAKRDAFVSDVLVREGSLVSPGQSVAVLRREGPELPAAEVVALLPGSTRPLLAPGIPLRFTLQGHQNVERRLVVREVADSLLSPSEAVLLLGERLAASVAPRGPVALVRATLPSGHFTVAGEERELYDGMIGRAELPLRSERLIFRLLPNLRERDGR